MSEIDLSWQAETSTEVERAKDYSGLRWGQVTPTDLDLSIDFGEGSKFAFVECKGRGKQWPAGQKKHIEHLTDLGGKRCLAVVAEHDLTDADKHVKIPVAYCEVLQWRLGGWADWVPCRRQVYVWQVLDSWRDLEPREFMDFMNGAH